MTRIWYFSDLYRVHWQAYLKWPWALIQAQPAAQRSKIGILEPVLPPFSCSSGLLTLLVGISNFRRSSSPAASTRPSESLLRHFRIRLYLRARDGVAKAVAQRLPQKTAMRARCAPARAREGSLSTLTS